MNPTVSVLMPMRNAEPFVRQALTSILAESTVTLEVVVVDDGSEDGSDRAVRSVGDERVRVIAGPQRGIAAAFNAGLAEVRGAITMRCDSDDRFAPGRVADQAAWLEANPEFGAICGSFYTIDAQGRRLATLETGPADQEITDELRSGVTRTHLCTFAVRTPLLRELGGCRPYFATAEDIDLQLRLGSVARVWYAARPAYAYRIHGASVTHRQADVRRLFFEQTARTFASQRRERGIDELDRGFPPEPPADEGAPASSASHQQGMLLGQAWREHEEGHKWQAIRTGWRACQAAPRKWSAWKSLAALIVKP